MEASRWMAHSKESNVPCSAPTPISMVRRYSFPHTSQRPIGSSSSRSGLEPVRRVLIVGVQQGLVLAVEHMLLRVLGTLFDPLPLDVHHDQLLVGVHAADPGRGEGHL